MMFIASLNVSPTLTNMLQMEGPVDVNEVSAASMAYNHLKHYTVVLKSKAPKAIPVSAAVKKDYV